MTISAQRPSVTSTATVSGNVGTQVRRQITANFTIESIEVSGTNLEIYDDGTDTYFQPRVNTTAGAFTGTLTVTGARGFIATQDVTATLNSVSITLLPPTNLAASSITMTSFVLSFTAAASATEYHISIDGIMPNSFVVASGDTIILGAPGRTYNIRVRSSDGTNNSAFSSALSVRTLDDVTPDPDPGVTPRRAYEVPKAMCLQGHFNYNTATSPWQDHVRAGGWMASMYAPMASVGILRWRNSFGGNDVKTTVLKLWNNHGAKFEGTLSDNRVADTQSPRWMIDYAKNNFFPGGTCILNSIQGLNEPNNPDNKTHRTNAPKDVIQSCNQWLDRMIDFYAGDFAGVRKVSYSPWGRERDQMLRIVYADELGPWRSQITNPGTVSLDPYETPDGLTWQDDVLPRLDELNFHYYTGGREPTLAGTPGTVLDENGSKVTSIKLDDSLHELRILALSTPDYYSGGEDRKLSVPYSCTEGGFHHQGPGAIDPNLVRDNNWSYVTSGVQAKYTQREHFEHMLRGVGLNGLGHYVWYEFMDNPNKHGNIYGSVTYKKVGGVFEYTPRPLYWTQLWTAKLFYDSASTAETFTVNNLDFTLGNQPGFSQFTNKIKHLLFQKASGLWYLALWFDHESWNRTTNDPAGTEDFQSRKVRVTFRDGGKKCRSTRPYIGDPALSASWIRYNSFNATTTVDMDVHDDVTVLEITPT